MILIEHDGERMLVESLDGHEGCTVLKEGVPRPRHGECYRCPETDRWRIDKDKVREAELNNISKVDLVKRLVDLENLMKERGF